MSDSTIRINITYECCEESSLVLRRETIDEVFVEVTVDKHDYDMESPCVETFDQKDIIDEKYLYYYCSECGTQYSREDLTSLALEDYKTAVDEACASDPFARIT